MPATTNTISGGSCPQYCTLCFTSPDPTGSNIGFYTFGGGTNLGSPPGGLYLPGDSQLLIDDISAYLILTMFVYMQRIYH